MRRFDGWVRWGSLVGFAALLIYSLFVYPVLEENKILPGRACERSRKMGLGRNWG